MSPFARDTIRLCCNAVMIAVVVLYFGDKLLTAYLEGDDARFLGYLLAISGAVIVGLVGGIMTSVYRHRNRRREE